MTTSLRNDLFLRACLGHETERTPVWLMRQAGRYMAEYRAVRARAGSFMDLARSRELATEVTLQPVRRFGLDAAILFSDILTIPDAMGLGLSFQPGQGPRFEHPLRDEAAVAALQVPDLERLRYVFNVVASVREALDGQVPLIGFAGSPWTLACYMVQGQGSRDWHDVKRMLYARSDLMHRILELNAEAVAQYLNAQIDAGAQAVMVFDSWGGALSAGAFREFSLAYTQRVLQGLKRTDAQGQVVPRIVFTKGGGLWLDAMATLPCDVLGLDWTMSLGRAREQLAAANDLPGAGAPAPRPRALQGNLDPAILLSSEDAIRTQVRAVLDDFGPPQADSIRHIFNLGHGISQFTPPEHVAILVDEVGRHSRQQRTAR